jgi:hypothetical protein
MESLIPVYIVAGGILKYNPGSNSTKNEILHTGIKQLQKIGNADNLLQFTD